MASFSIALNVGVQPLPGLGQRDAARVAPGPVEPDAVTEQSSDASHAVNAPGDAEASPQTRNEAGSDSPAGDKPRLGADEEDVGPDGLTQAEEDLVDDLRARDAEVRRHEEAHARVGGQYAGQPSYSFQTGPDGKRYAIGGEVPIDVAPVPDDPEATIAKMSVVKRAALAPAEPSGQDRRVAALADSQSLEAQAQLNAQRLEDQAARLEENRIDRTADADARGRLFEGAAAVSRGEESEPGQTLAKAA